jgi:hypothetical protein
MGEFSKANLKTTYFMVREISFGVMAEGTQAGIKKAPRTASVNSHMLMDALIKDYGRWTSSTEEANLKFLKKLNSRKENG